MSAVGQSSQAPQDGAPQACGAGRVWRSHAFDELSPHDLYALLQLRSAVFVVEQNCLFLDLDGADSQAVHLLGWRDGRLDAYARCFGPGVVFPQASIGRIATRMAARGGGLGHHLVREAIALVLARWGRQPICIGAQARLRHFYEGHGFVDLNKPYVEDGIDHLEMVWYP
jgi:ElaA protein